MDRNASHGPWREIFSGKWEGYDVELFINPEKIIVVNIYSNDDVVSVMSKFFLAEGNYLKLVDAFDGFLIAVSKKQPASKVNFLGVSTGPVYYKKELINEKLEEMYDLLETEAEHLIEVSKAYPVNLTDLLHAPEQFSVTLLEEPIVLVSFVTGKKLVVSEKKEESVFLGFKSKTKEKAEEPVSVFSRTSVLGENRKNAMKIIAEGLSINGVTVVVFDEDNFFSEMAKPNLDFPHGEYPFLQPVGMPLKNIDPADVNCDIRLVGSKVFKEVLGIRGENGLEAFRVIEKAIEEKKPSSVAELEEAVIEVMDEKVKFYAFRAIRMLRVIEQRFPGLFTGKTDPSLLVPFYSKTGGVISRVDLSNLPLGMKKAIVFSAVNSLLEAARNRRIIGLKAVIMLPNAAKYCPREPEKESEKRIIEAINELPEHGLGYCIGADYEVDLFEELVETSTLLIEFISAKEVAVKPVTKKPYRVILRPFLSA